MFYGFDPEALSEWQAQQNETGNRSDEENAEWLREFRDTHPFCTSWSDNELLLWRNTSIFKQTSPSDQRQFCVVCKTDVGPGPEGFVVCSFRCALTIAEKEEEKSKARYDLGLEIKRKKDKVVEVT